MELLFTVYLLSLDNEVFGPVLFRQYHCCCCCCYCCYYYYYYCYY